MKSIDFKRAAIVLCTVLFAGAVSAETVAEWQWGGEKPARFSYKREIMSVSYPDEKTPDGDAVVAVKYDEAAKHPQARLVFNKKVQLTKDAKYKLTFWFKASAPLKATTIVQVLAKPYNSIKGAGRTLSFSTEWQKSTRTFVADQDYDVMIAIPMIAPKEVAEGTEIFLGPVCVEKLDAAGDAAKDAEK